MMTIPDPYVYVYLLRNADDLYLGVGGYRARPDANPTKVRHFRSKSAASARRNLEAKHGKQWDIVTYRLVECE